MSPPTRQKPLPPPAPCAKKHSPMTTHQHQHNVDAHPPFPECPERSSKETERLHTQVCNYLRSLTVRDTDDAGIMDPTVRDTDDAGIMDPTALSTRDASIFLLVETSQRVEDMLGIVGTCHVTSGEAVCMALLYMNRFLHATRLPLTARTSPVLFIAALTVAAKSLHDTPYNNTTFARIAALPTLVLNMLEIELLRALRFRLHLLPDRVTALRDALLSAADPDPRHLHTPIGSALLAPQTHADSAPAALRSASPALVHGRGHGHGHGRRPSRNSPSPYSSAQSVSAGDPSNPTDTSANRRSFRFRSFFNRDASS